MARPRKEGVDYFPHDVDASQDDKIEMMRSVYGNDGYAFYFIALERIYRSESGELDLSNEMTEITLAKKMMVTKSKLRKMIETSIEIGLFCRENFEKRKILVSDGIKKRLLLINTLRDKWRENKGNSESFLNGKPCGKPLENPLENPVENAIKESKVKGKESKVNKSDYVTLYAREFESLVSEFGHDFTNRCIRFLNDYKAASGKKYQSDYHAIRSWVIDRVQQQQKTVPLAKKQMQVHSESIEQLTPQELTELENMLKRLEGEPK